MTTKEKLELALKGLEKIANGKCSNEKYFATRLYNKLTTPRTETVEVKRWKILNTSVPSMSRKRGRGEVDTVSRCNSTKISYQGLAGGNTLRQVWYCRKCKRSHEFTPYETNELSEKQLSDILHNRSLERVET